MKKTIAYNFIPLMKEKALSDNGCKNKVIAIALSKKGNVLGYARNGHRNDIPSDLKGRGLHAEAALVKKYGRKIDTIVLSRFGRGLEMLPINPCPMCTKMLNKLGIKVKIANDYDI